MRGARVKINVAASMVAGLMVGNFLPSPARGDVTKANNTDALNLGSSYTGGTAPVAADKIIFDSNILGALTYSIGDNVTVNGLSFTTFVGNQQIDGVAGKKLTIGAGGIVSTNTTADITINADLNLSASQPFALPNAARTLILNGVVSSAAGVNLTIGTSGTATNNAIVQLNTAATYTGQTKIIGGTLKMGAANVLPSSTVVVVGGTGNNTLLLNGFSQAVSGLDVTGSNTRRILNGLAGTPAVLTVNVASGTAWAYGASLGVTGATQQNLNDSNFAIVKTGSGLQELTNATNIFLNGGITISGGALGFSLVNGGTSSALTLDGGVFQNQNATTSVTFTRGFGTGATQFQMTANGGGFSAKGQPHVINIGGASAAVDWLSAPGTTGLVGTLKFGHESSNADVQFQNPINLNGGQRTIDVADNAASAADFTTLSGVVADGSGAGGVTKTGAGILVFSAQNTYTGPTNINGGILTAVAPGTVPTTGGINVANGAALAVRTTGFTSAQIDALRAVPTYDPLGGGFGYDVPTGNTFTPANAFSGNFQLYKLGGGDLTLNTANTHTGGTNVVNGRLLLATDNALGSGTLTLNTGGTIASGDATARSISVPTTVAGNPSIGAAVENGTITFTSQVNMSGGARAITINSPTTFAAGFTNGSLNQKIGNAMLTVGGTSTNTGVIEVREGTFVLAAGATLTAADALRVMENTAGGTAVAEIRGTYNIAGTGGNIRVGHDTAPAIGNNILNIFGTLGFTSFTTGGATQMGSQSTNATINMFPGSVLATKQIINSTASFGSAITTINIDGGTLRALDTRTTYMNGLTGGAFIRAGGATVDTNGFNITIAQNLQHDAALGATPDGGLKKTGAGTLVITGAANSYTGLTTVSAGTLQVNVVNGTGTGAVAVNSGGTLGGTGSIAGPITLDAGAKLAPGASAGTLTVGSMSLDAAVNGPGTGALQFEIGSTYDQVVGTSITYGAGQLELDDFSFTPLTGIGPGNYTLLTGVTAGSLGPNVTASAVPGLSGYDASLSQSNGNVILTLTGVPEPSTAGAIVVAAAGLLARRRRRRP